MHGRLGTPSGYRDVGFTSMSGMSGADGVCVVCHTTTMYHNVTSLVPVEHHDNAVCTDCHPHDRGFPSFTTVWNPVKRWFAGLFTTDSAYARPPAWVTPPGLQNRSMPAQAWENGLKKLKVSFEVVRQDASQENNGQSAIKDDIIMYYHNDHLGTPLFMTGEDGSIVWRREQTPFGITSYERGTTAENLSFPGQYFDAETGLAQNWHRDYDAGLGRYVEADPIGQMGGINGFIFVDNDAINNYDASGLCPAELSAEETGGDWYYLKNYKGNDIESTQICLNLLLRQQEGSCGCDKFEVCYYEIIEHARTRRKPTPGNQLAWDYPSPRRTGIGVILTWDCAKKAFVDINEWR